MTEQELYDLLWKKICDSKDAHYAAVSSYGGNRIPDKDWGTKIPHVYHPEAYAEMARDLVGPLLSGKEVDLKAGTTVRIVMVSRLGDFGITTDLKAVNGYIVRVHPEDHYLTNCRLTRKKE